MSAATEPLLVARDITVRFGGVTANASVDVDVRAGELVGVIGPNGAGKTTFIDAITGFVPSTGTVHLVDDDLTGMKAAKRSRSGLVRTWQSVELFDDLTVGDNLAVAEQKAGAFDLFADLFGLSRRTPEERIIEALDRVGLADVAAQFPLELSHGRRKLVGVARSLITNPRILCLDEPAAGLDETESVALGGHLRRLADDGLTMLLVDHDMALVMGICDRIYVMETGRIIASGTPAEIRNDPVVREAYLGTSTDQEVSP